MTPHRGRIGLDEFFPHAGRRSIPQLGEGDTAREPQPPRGVCRRRSGRAGVRAAIKWAATSVTGPPTSR